MKYIINEPVSQYRRVKYYSLAGIFLSLIIFCFDIHAQSVRIPWQTMSEGMGRYSEGNLRTVGVIGQVITGKSVDGNTVVTSGFLAGLRSSYTVSVKEVTTDPDGFNLSQNYPNPFNPATTIAYRLNKESFVDLKVQDLFGRTVSTLAHETQSAGAYSTQWNATTQPSGLYVYRIDAKLVDGNSFFTDQKIMMLVR